MNMPHSTGVLDLQRRSQQIGRIRIGQLVPTKGGKMRPAKLDTFRFTTGSRGEAEAIAVLYGGDVREWRNPRSGAAEWEVITSKAEIGVTVPPRSEVISQWYEMWTAGGCQRRCDSQHEQISQGPCLCPHAEDPGDRDEVADAARRRAEMAKMNPPQACKLVTRISVMIPDLPGLGVFRLDTGSYYAGVEIGDAARLMAVARDKGVFLPAMLRIEQRQRVAGGETRNYPVPVLDVLVTFRDIVTGAIAAGGVAASLPPAPGEQQRAITSGVPAQVPAQARPRPQRPPSAQQIADAAAKATIPAQIAEMKQVAEEHDLSRDMICPPDGDIYEELDGYLHGRWEDLRRNQEEAGSGG